MQGLILDPIIEKLAIGFIGLIGGLVAYWTKGFFEDRHKRLEETKNELKETKDKYEQEYRSFYNLIHDFRDEFRHSNEILKDSLNDAEKRNIKEHAEVFSRIQGMAQQLVQCVESVSELKGRLNDQIVLGSNNISTIGHMSRQIDALFRVIDGPKRATDSN